MTGRQKMQAAFSGEGANEIPAVICYEDIYIRDHWKQLTSCPWWYQYETDIDRQVMWYDEVVPNIGQDWFSVPRFATREERANIAILEKADGIYRFDKKMRRESKLYEPQISGSHLKPAGYPEINTPDDLDKLVPPVSQADASDIIGDVRRNGCGDLAERLTDGVCKDKCPCGYIPSPLWSCANIWGNYEEFFVKIIEKPELVTYACERYAGIYCNQLYAAAALGAEVIWIEECFTDMISPEAYKKYSLPYVRQLAETVRCAGMKSIYYFCGNISGKLDLILSAGADAVSFEESKKNFRIDIGELAEYIRGRCVLFGNLDATSFLQDCSEEQLKREIARQIKAGRVNKSRFVMSMGSPVTPGTPAEKVRLYCDLAHDMGRGPA